MAEKRPLGTLGPVMYSKLPRLADPGPGHSLPPAGNQDTCSYKGAYFSCPVGGTPQAGSERLPSWAPYPALYPSSVAAPSLRADGLLANGLLYRSPAEGAEKVQDSGFAELLPFGPQAHPYPCPPLAAPKPVYRSPPCYGLPTCLGDGPAKRPLDVDWTLVSGPLLPSVDTPCSLAPAPGKGQSLDGTFLHGSSGKDSLASFSPCQAFLEKYRTIHNTGFLASKYTGPYSGDPKQGMSEGPPSPWTQLAQPLGLPCQDAVPTHYPLPHAPAALPFPPACRHPDKQGSGYSSVLPLQPLGAHKGAGYQASSLASPYLRQQAAQTPYMPPVGLDTYSYPSAPLPVPSPGLKLEPPLAPRCPLDLGPQTLGFPYARDDLSLYGASPGLGGTPPSQSSVQAVPQPGASQRAGQPLLGGQPCMQPGRPTGEPALEAEKTRLPSCRKEQLLPLHHEPQGAPIVIRDSPDPHTPPAPPPCAQERPSLLQKAGARPPSSPPMPIIGNVFSLAPYRDYLDGQAPEPTTQPDSDLAPAASRSNDRDCNRAPPGQECPTGTHRHQREEVALDLSVKKPEAEAPPVKVPSPAAPTLPVTALEVPEVGGAGSDLPSLKKMVTDATGLPGQPVTAEAVPATNFHSSVAFMFRKFKILRPAPSPAAAAPATAPSASAAPPVQPVSAPAPAPLGLRIVSQPLPVACFNLALPSPPAVAVAAPIPTLAPAAGPAPSPPPARADSLEQRFTGLHASLCDAISGSVAHSPPEKLREWLETAGPRGRAAWQDCQGVQGLLDKLPAQVQSGVERLFPRLPPASVDHVLQEHRVELRPTTLSEERALRERALRGCTLRMLKLLALRQLPDIYPDLLGLQWRDCVRRQLGDFDTEAGAVSPSEPTVAGGEPESLALVRNSPAPKVRKLGRKPSTPGLDGAEATSGGGSRGDSPAPVASTSSPGPALRARFRSLLESAWLNGMALPTWGHRTSGPDRPQSRPLLGSQSHQL
ncbi:hypothetical protein TREES_T100004665 [Tupaia chinensis]|uniref:Uncharacterized protein n=1 Tax=Tupaia chinensis TaxID=246437 RepID=L8YE08_TUPCH|nr:hypothetical protein TREES_T100004665 [Tupaia chinensis]